MAYSRQSVNGATRCREPSRTETGGDESHEMGRDETRRDETRRGEARRGVARRGEARRARACIHPWAV